MSSYCSYAKAHCVLELLTFVHLSLRVFLFGSFFRLSVFRSLLLTLRTSRLSHAPLFSLLFLSLFTLLSLLPSGSRASSPLKLIPSPRGCLSCERSARASRVRFSLSLYLDGVTLGGRLTQCGHKVPDSVSPKDLERGFLRPPPSL